MNIPIHNINILQNLHFGFMALCSIKAMGATSFIVVCGDILSFNLNNECHSTFKTLLNKKSIQICQIGFDFSHFISVCSFFSD